MSDEGELNRWVVAAFLSSLCRTLRQNLGSVATSAFGQRVREQLGYLLQHPEHGLSEDDLVQTEWMISTCERFLTSAEYRLLDPIDEPPH